MNNRGLKIALVVMLLLNAVSITLLWTGGRHSGGPMGGHGGDHPPRGGPDRIAEELHFSESQTLQFETMRLQHHNRLLHLTEEMVAIRRQLYSAASYSDSLLADSLITQVAAKSAQSDRITYQHFAELRKICDPDQQKIFDDVISDFASHIGSPQVHRPMPHDR